MTTLEYLTNVELATAYTLSELDDTARDRAYSKWLEHTDVWLEPEEYLEWYASENLEQMGYDVSLNRKDISWSIGSYNGSDYFVFKASVSVRKWLAYHKLTNKYRAAANTWIRHKTDAMVYITWNYGSYQSTHTYSESEWDLPYHASEPSPQADAQLAELEELIHEDARDHMGNIQYTLTADYEYQLSFERFEEDADDMEWLFDEEGNVL